MTTTDAWAYMKSHSTGPIVGSHNVAALDVYEKGSNVIDGSHPGSKNSEKPT